MNSLAKMGLAGLFAFGLAQAAVNFPFPQMSDYGGNATLLSNKAQASEDLKKQFQSWMRDMYNEKGDIAGVRSDPGSNQYFSEGVGYGMLLMVYFSDNTTSYQSQFDKIWNFYKKFQNENGLMIWKIGNLSESWDAGNGAALDGDIDAAAALVMAYYQFGDEKYKEDAKKLIQAMKKSEFESNGLHLPGDKWGDAAKNRKNPGYFDPAYMPLFAAIDTENAEFWSTTAYDANMKLYEMGSAEVSTGLIDDWMVKNGDSWKSEDDEYGYDAPRAPWRNAKAICWHGDQRALAIDKKMAEFVSGVSAANMKGPIKRSSGSLGNDHNSTFVTSLMTALISDAKYQSKLDEYWKEAVALGDENYFNQSLKLLNGLLVSGNMPDLSKPVSTSQSSSSSAENPPQSSSSVVPPQSSSSVVGPEQSSSSTIALHVGRVATPTVSLHGRTLEIAGSEIARIDLFSVSGAAVGTLWEGKTGGSVKVSLEGIPSGLYVVKVKVLGETIVRKINVR